MLKKLLKLLKLLKIRRFAKLAAQNELALVLIKSKF